MTYIIQLTAASYGTQRRNICLFTCAPTVSPVSYLSVSIVWPQISASLPTSHVHDYWEDWNCLRAAYVYRLHVHLLWHTHKDLICITIIYSSKTEETDKSKHIHEDMVLHSTCLKFSLNKNNDWKLGLDCFIWIIFLCFLKYQMCWGSTMCSFCSVWLHKHQTVTKYSCWW